MNIYVSKILEYISVFLAMLVVIPFHEFAHGFAAVKNGDLTPKIQKRYTINPLAHFDIYGLLSFVLVGFGWSKPMPINPNNFKHYKKGCFWVSISGVLANYLTAFLILPVFYLSLKIPSFGYFTYVLQNSLYFIFSLSLVFFVFNLLPIYPLDGFRVIDVFNKKRGKIYQFLRNYGSYILLIFIALGVIADFTNLWYLDALGIFLSHASSIIGYPITLFWGLMF